MQALVVDGLVSLQQLGMIERTGPDTFRITDQGRELLRQPNAVEALAALDEPEGST